MRRVNRTGQQRYIHLYYNINTFSIQWYNGAVQPIIYIVGKPYPDPNSVDEIKALGYRLGLFLDSKITPKHPEQYERIIPLDFSDTSTLRDQISSLGQIEVDGVYCLYENYILAKAEIGSVLNLPALSSESARLCTDKNLMRQAFAREDPEISPRHAVVTNEADLLAFAGASKYPLMLKPANLVKSLLVLRCNTEAELLENFRYASANIADLYEKNAIYGRQPQLIVEEFISGTMCSIAAMVDADGVPHFCEGIVSLTTAGEVGRDDTFLYERLLPGDFDAELSARLYETARKGIKALKMSSSSAHVELMYDGLDVKIVEIGARTGGYRTRMYKECYGINLLEQELRMAVGQRPQLDGQMTSYCSVFELFPSADGRFGSVTGAIDPAAYKVYKVKASAGQQIGQAKHGYKAAAVVIATAETREQLDTLRHSVRNLAVEVQA